MGYTQVFGGATLQAAQVAYRAVALTANVSLLWPPFATTTTDYIARLMNVTPSGAGLAITLDDATQVSPGQDVFFNNVGGFTFSVLDKSGGTICTVAAGVIKYLYLTDNSTTAGTWSVLTLGAGTSSTDAAQVAGYGLKALSATLNLAPVVTTLSANYSVVAADRSKVFIWTGGSGTITLPPLATASSSSDWEIEVRNQGTGILTMATSGGELIDAAASLSMNVTESCFIHTGPTAWYTVGRGRNTSFNFTKLAKSVTGGTTTLSQTEAANVIQVYTGALISSETVVVPQAVQVYYITNSTTGAHTFTVKTAAAGGATVTITQNASAVVYCDGTNIINCNTSGVTVNSVSLAAGSVGAPSLSFAAESNTGIYQPTTGQMAVTISGSQVALFTASGLNNCAVGATTASTGAFTTLSTTGAITAGGAINKVTITAPATGSTLTIADGKTLTASNTLTLTGTDASSIAFGAGGTVAYRADNLSVFAATTSAQLAGVISDETGTGALVFATSPALVTPNIGVPSAGTLTNCTGLPIASGVSGLGTGVAAFLATPSSANLAAALTDETGSGAAVFATSPMLVTPALGVASATTINKVTITAPAASATLTIANTKTLTVSNTVTLSGTDGSTIAFGVGGTVVYAGAATSSGLTMSTARLLGRTTAASGAIEEITPSTGLSLTGGNLSVTVAPIFGIVSGSNFTTSSNTLVDITGLTAALAANASYTFTAQLSCSGGQVGGLKVGVNYSVAGATLEAGALGIGGTVTSISNTRLSAFNTASALIANSNAVGDSTVTIIGTVVTGANAGNLTVQIERGSGSALLTVYTGSMLSVVKVA